jgi:hypothetical protein
MDAVTKSTPMVRRAVSIGVSVLVFGLLAYWIVMMAIYVLVYREG